jgi:hypothetical protein
VFQRQMSAVPETSRPEAADARIAPLLLSAIVEMRCEALADNARAKRKPKREQGTDKAYRRIGNRRSCAPWNGPRGSAACG